MNVKETSAPLKYLVTKIGSGKTPSGGADVYVKSGVMLLCSQNIHCDGLRLDDVVYIDSAIDEAMSDTRVMPNDAGCQREKLTEPRWAYKPFRPVALVDTAQAFVTCGAGLAGFFFGAAVRW